jgi:hypothetical protein
MNAAFLRPCMAMLVWFGLLSNSFADSLLPRDRPMDQVIDYYIHQRLHEENITPAPQVDDATLIRRLTLDLVGRIPTPEETKSYLESKDPNKRSQLVDRLLASPAFIRHQANLFDAMMTSGTRNGSLRDYFNKALSENRSWNRIFREMVNPDQTDPVQRPASEFLRARITDVDKVTNDVSVLFFGVNVSCAQCHNHPLVESWKQDHYYGMKSFFSRTFDNGGFLAEREFGIVKFKPPKGPEREAKMMFLTGNAIDDPGMREPNKDEAKKERETFEEHKKKKTIAPAPQFSARAKLVEVALKPGEVDYFARNFANRLWHRFMGRGLVMPLDQMHSENSPSHPDLLAWLARFIWEKEYDLRPFVRGLVMSQTYSRSSRWSGSGEEIPLPNTYAITQLKALTPYQLATSMKIASSDPKIFENQKREELEKRLESLEKSSMSFGSRIAQPTDDFQIGVNEALLFSNNDRMMKEFLGDSKESILGRAISTKERSEAIEMIVQNIFCRKPTTEEMKSLEEYLAKRSDRLTEAYRQMIWALITSSEFRFNY